MVKGLERSFKRALERYLPKQYIDDDEDYLDEEAPVEGHTKGGRQKRSSSARANKTWLNIMDSDEVGFFYVISQISFILVRPLFFYLLFNKPSSSRFLKIQIKIKIRFHVFLFPPIQNFTQNYFFMLLFARCGP